MPKASRAGAARARRRWVGRRARQPAPL